MTDNQTRSELVLSIRDRGKAIPYPESGPRPDGAENYGFKALKGRSQDADLIPEVLDNIALKNAVIALNARETPFFTVGCEKSCNQDQLGYWMKGYLEFSFNYTELVADARYYFEIFFHFNTWFRKQPQEAVVQYHFELEGAAFLDASTAHGFSLTVWITTSTLPAEESTRAAWSWALNLLVEFLNTVPTKLGLRGRIY